MLKTIKTNIAAIVFIAAFAFSAVAQDTAPVAMSTADVMRERIAKARAYIVVKNFPAAIYELDNIKRESADPTVHGVVNVLLMNSYLEQGDYKRATEFLNDLSKDLKASKPNSAANYFAVASQVIKNAKTQLERYRALGFNVSDRNLPSPAAADSEKMREILELVVNQSKELGKTAKDFDNTMALVEGATAARSSFAKDDYDANRWKTEVADAREQLTNSRSTVINAVAPTVPAGMENMVAATTPAVSKPAEQSSILLPVSKETPASIQKTVQPEVKKAEPIAKTEPFLKPVEPPAAEPKKAAAEVKQNIEPLAENAETRRNRVVIGSAPKPEPVPEETVSDEAPAEQAVVESPKSTGPLEVGSLVPYATKRNTPAYPSIARNMRLTGIVKVDVIVDEEGKVIEVQNADGPTLLQNAAAEAVRKWKFKPFTRDGEPVRALGFVSFNFNL